MALSPSDIVWYLTGATSDGGSQSDPNQSLGNYRSSTEFVSDSIENLFDNVDSTEAQSGDTEYRCLCIKNTGSSTWSDVKFYINTVTPSPDTHIEFAVEVPTGSDTAGYAQTIANESTAPTVGSGNVSSWSAATTYASGVGVNQGSHDANLDAGEIVFLWIKRVVSSNASAYSNDYVSITARGTTS